MRRTILACALILAATLATAQADGPIVGPGCCLAWDAVPPADDLIGYRVYWRNSVSTPYTFGDPQSPTIAPMETQISCLNVGITRNGQYYFVVTAVYEGAESGPSNEVPFVLSGAVLAAPTNARVIQSARVSR
jgi:hypothetical protein